MKLRTHLVLFLLLFTYESIRSVREFGNSIPHVGDSIEVHNIGYNLAHARGYRFDWDNPDWRRLLQAQNGDGSLNFILSRHSSHPTMFRPPMMPFLVAGIIRLFPNHSFVAWRIFDSAGFSIAACILCQIAFTNASVIGLAAMLVMLLNDQLRQTFIPGWWTEGVAFDLLCVIAWLFTNPSCLRPKTYCLIAGIALGFLCLDRAAFVLICPPLCMLLAIAGKKPASSRVKSTMIILAISVAVQLPWWIRNMEISGRFLPLGTQAGFNLPDEYGKIVFKRRIWTGIGMRDAWTPITVATNDIPLPPGFTEKTFDQLWTGNRRLQALFAATFCTSLESEIAVSDRGKQTAVSWIRSHYSSLPALMLVKVEELTFFFHTSLTVSAVIAVIGFIAFPRQRDLLSYLAAFVAMYFAMIAVTHVVWWRFLVPILPAIYIANSIGIYAIACITADFILARFLRKLL